MHSETRYPLAVVAAWEERTQSETADYFARPAHEGLEREASFVWDALAIVSGDLEAQGGLDDLRRAAAENLVDPVLWEDEWAEAKAGDPGAKFASFRESPAPFDDMVEETQWWICFNDDGFDFNPGVEIAGTFEREPCVEPPGDAAPQPRAARPKIGRNQPCPCGSGKKYKKCCGA